MSEPTELASAELTVLDIPQLRDLVEELFDVKHKWYSIGLRLNIPDDALEGIDKTCKDDLDTALRRMLQEWKSREQPAWVTVVEALRSRSVRAYSLADNLHERFIGTMQQSLPTTRRQQQSVSQLVQYTPESALKMVIKWEIVNNKKLIIIIILIGGSTIVMLILNGTVIYFFITRRAVVSPRFNHNMYLIRTPEFRCYDVNYDSAGNFKLPSIKGNPECSNEICHQRHQPDGSSILCLIPIAQCTTAAIPNPGESEFIHTRLLGAGRHQKADFMSIGSSLCCALNPFAVLVFILFILLALIFYLLISVLFLIPKRNRHREQRNLAPSLCYLVDDVDIETAVYREQRNFNVLFIIILLCIFGCFIIAYYVL